ncbi:hypothetical protein CC1G_05243 [Coprinopsis cinerea okayama7|uniref:HAM1-like N-terminal domain-containing protein n=1 Tax=Coprinopsis cinerea (strain Okayama-7 / 130 / ATCC MYA-4618 / FGSC 9003) TaxID=240176 RepID=A8PCB4_COPC7|nr:hypothetical protein CC1G_05243 [Coprinopsis cinerea okayama7\|eukprot:XP_001840357.2 hypothetical protein CC1G_05243 [Coprinopsis cinerea okayama7\
MDACMSLFGRRRRLPPEDENSDEDPLLPTHTEPNRQGEVLEQNKKVKKGKGGRLIDFHEAEAVNGDNSQGDFLDGSRRRASNTKDAPPTLVGKLIDIVAAFQAGKLPTQDQISHFLRTVLNSRVLDHVIGDEIRDSKFLCGSGPTTKRGQQVLASVQNVLQALLEFGLEKNDDNTIQDFFYQLREIDTGDMSSGFNIHLSKENFSKAKDASESMAHVGKKSASELKDKVPGSSEVANDTAILLHALRTLVQSALTSTIFRLLLVDVFSILRDLAARGASDVGKAASHVHAAARDMEKNLADTDVGEKVNQAMEGIQKTDSGHDVQEKGMEVAGSAVDTVKGLMQSASEKAGEWGSLGAAAMDEAKEDFLARIQQVLIRAQEDPASRDAIRAIVILARKYADKVADLGDVAADTAAKAASDLSTAARGISPMPSSTAWKPPATYPPPNDLYPPVPDEIPGVHSKTGEQGKPLKAALGDLKIILERVARGHPIDKLIRALIDIGKDLKELPFDVEEMVVNEADFFVRDVKGKGKEEVQSNLEGQRGKGRRRKKKGKKGGSKSIQTPDEQDSSQTATPFTTAPHTPVAPSEPPKTPGPRPNVLRVYFSRIGRYLDRAMDEPGWITSRKGSKELEKLFNDGRMLLNVVGEAAVDVGEAIVESGAEENGQHATSENTDEAALKIRRQFREHTDSLLKELEAYISAVENDRTAMKLLRSLDELAHAVSDLLASGKQMASTAKNQAQKHSASLASRLRSSVRWTEWVAWSIPRLLQLIPPSAIPIPSLEARSESGGWEAGLYALFIKGDALEAGVSSASKGRRRGRGGLDPVTGGIESTLIPDEIVFKEWTEVRIDMANETPLNRPTMSRSHSYTRHSMGRDHHLVSERSVTAPHTHEHDHLHNARVDTTSRIHMHFDGIRAKVDGLGYYFKYGLDGAWFGYEDEGVMNVDIGMRKPHAGLRCDIEIELTSEHTPYHHHRRTGRGGLPVGELVGEGIEGEGDFDMLSVPEYVIQPPGSDAKSPPGTAVIVEGEARPSNAEDSEEGVANLDVQRIIDSGAIGREREQVGSASTGFPYSAFGHYNRELEPMFKVVDVNIEMQGVKVLLQKSRHWILNKVLVQPLAGPTVHLMVKQLLEAKVKESLEELAMELARLSRDAAVHGEIRREKTRRRKLQERRDRIERLVRQGYFDYRANEELLDELEAEDGLVEWIQDWANAISESGSRVAGRSGEEEETIRTRTSVNATSRGLVYHASTTRVDTQHPVVIPPMVFNKQTGQMEPAKEELRGKPDVVDRETDQSDITVAIGGGAQLFADKQVPYGHQNDAAGQGEEGQGLLSEVAEATKSTAREAIGIKGQVEARYQDDLRKERSSGWKSSAFDFP